MLGVGAKRRRRKERKRKRGNSKVKQDKQRVPCFRSLCFPPHLLSDSVLMELILHLMKRVALTSIQFGSKETRDGGLETEDGTREIGRGINMVGMGKQRG